MTYGSGPKGPDEQEKTDMPLSWLTGISPANAMEGSQWSLPAPVQSGPTMARNIMNTEVDQRNAGNSSFDPRNVPYNNQLEQGNWGRGNIQKAGEVVPFTRPKDASMFDDKGKPRDWDTMVQKSKAADTAETLHRALGISNVTPMGPRQ